MGSPPSSPMEAGVASLAIAFAALATGYLVVDAFGRLRQKRLDPILCMGLAPVTVVGLTLIIMLAHIMTSGAVLSNQLAMNLIIGFVLVGALAVRVALRASAVAASTVDASRVDASKLAGILVPGLLILSLVQWGAPVFSRLPLFTGGDNQWHMSFAGQLLNGASTPSSWFSGSFPNDYPWMFHALLAVFAQFIAGGRPIHAANVVHLFIVLGSVMVMFALGRELTGRVSGAVATALFGAMTGGWGFLITGATPTLLDPRQTEDVLRYLGDFIEKRSYNIAFHNLAPAYPRDLSFLLLESFLLLLLLGLKRRNLMFCTAAGAALGMIGLTAGESTFVGFAVAGLTVALVDAPRRLGLVTAIFAPALGIYALWIGPLIWNYVQHPGFNDLSDTLVVYPPLAIVGSWGVGGVFAVVGLRVALPRARTDCGVQVAGLVLLSSLVLLAAASLASRFLGPGVETLGRTHRYWPLLHLGLVLFAGYGFVRTLEVVRRAGRAAVVAAVIGVITLSSASPILSSLMFSRQPPSSLLLAAATDGGTILNAVSPSPGGSCVIAADPILASFISSFSGYRFLSGRRAPRWRSLFSPEEERTRAMASLLLVTGEPETQRWKETAERYGVDAVVISKQRIFSPGVLAFPDQESRGPYVVLWLNKECRALQ